MRGLPPGAAGTGGERRHYDLITFLSRLKYCDDLPQTERPS